MISPVYTTNKYAVSIRLSLNLTPYLSFPYYYYYYYMKARSLFIIIPVTRTVRLFGHGLDDNELITQPARAFFGPVSVNTSYMCTPQIRLLLYSAAVRRGDGWYVCDYDLHLNNT